MTKQRKSFTPNFKAQVALEALRNAATTGELSTRFGVHPTQIQTWKNELFKGASTIFTNENRKVDSNQEVQLEILERKIGQLTIENDYLKKNLMKFHQKNG